MGVSVGVSVGVSMCTSKMRALDCEGSLVERAHYQRALFAEALHCMLFANEPYIKGLFERKGMYFIHVVCLMYVSMCVSMCISRIKAL